MIFLVLLFPLGVALSQAGRKFHSHSAASTLLEDVAARATDLSSMTELRASFHVPAHTRRTALTALAVLMYACTLHWAWSTAGEPHKHAKAELEREPGAPPSTYVLAVEGMMCGNCEGKVTKDRKSVV